MSSICAGAGQGQVKGRCRAGQVASARPFVGGRIDSLGDRCPIRPFLCRSLLSFILSFSFGFPVFVVYLALFCFACVFCSLVLFIFLLVFCILLLVFLFVDCDLFILFLFYSSNLCSRSLCIFLLTLVHTLTRSTPHSHFYPHYPHYRQSHANPYPLSVSLSY